MFKSDTGTPSSICKVWIIKNNHIVLVQSWSLSLLVLRNCNCATQALGRMSSIAVLFLKQLKCSIMRSISVFELVKSALNSNDEVILRTIYDDLSCRLRSRRMVSTEEHSSFIGRIFGPALFIQEPAKRGTGFSIAVSKVKSMNFHCSILKITDTRVIVSYLNKTPAI